MSTGVCSYVQKHVIEALEGLSKFSFAENLEKPSRASITCFWTTHPTDWRSRESNLRPLSCKPWVEGSIPGFSSLSDETLSRGPVSM